MTETWPDPTLPTSAKMTQTLAALDQARQDAALDATTRALLDRAHAALRSALASGRPTVIQVPMENAPTPTPGHWDINDIYRRGE